MGAEAAAAVCEQFYAMLSHGAPARTQDERQEQLDAAAATLGEDRFEEASSELEQRFYALEDELRTRLLEYSRANGLL